MAAGYIKASGEPAIVMQAAVVAANAGQWLHIKVEQVQCDMPNLTCAGM
jgi:hypothetical protein